MDQLCGAIEAGGTKFVCAVGSGPDDLREETRFETSDPARTLGRAVEFLRRAQDRHGALAAVGIGAFGPVDLHPAGPTWGRVTRTPKPGWNGADFAGPIARALGRPVGFDTDVNAAALGEREWGAARGLDDVLYLTIGTGIGGGAVVNGRPLHGLVHPEMGHMRVPHDRAGDPFAGDCPYHGDCLEGLASGRAIAARWGRPAQELPPEHPAWALETEYLAHAVANLTLTLSPRRVIIGGGVMSSGVLFAPLRRRVAELLNGYVQAPELLERIDQFIVPPGLGGRAGVLGALVLARRAAAGGLE